MTALTRLGAVAAGLIFAAAATASCDAADDGFPVVAKDYVALGGPGPSTATLDPMRSRLAGPHFDLRFTTAEVTATTLSPKPARAADGYEFLVLSADGQPRPGSFPSTDGRDQPSADVEVDGALRHLDTVPVTGSVVVSVPKGHDAALKITHRGRAQSISMRTGRRGPDAVAAYYGSRTVTATDGGYTGRANATYRAARLTATVTVSLADAVPTLQAWVPDLGWAAPGRTWLHISGAKTAGGVSADNAEDLGPLDRGLVLEMSTRLTVDRAATFGIETPGGAGAPAAANGQPTQLVSNTVLVFDVPVTFTTGTLTIHPPETVKTRSDVPGTVTWTAHFPPGRVALTHAP